MSRGPDWQIAADVKSENNIGFIKLSDTKTRGYPSSHIFPITEEIDHVFRQTHHIQLWKHVENRGTGLLPSRPKPFTVTALHLELQPTPPRSAGAGCPLSDFQRSTDSACAHGGFNGKTIGKP